MILPDTNSQHELPNSRLALALLLGLGALVGGAVGFTLVSWVFDRVVGSDAAGIFLLGFAGGLVLVALVGSQVMRLPLWVVLIAGQVTALIGLLLLIV